jgi:hypothetical protein
MATICIEKGSHDQCNYQRLTSLVDDDESIAEPPTIGCEDTAFGP